MFYPYSEAGNLHLYNQTYGELFIFWFIYVLSKVGYITNDFLKAELQDGLKICMEKRYSAQYIDSKYSMMSHILVLGIKTEKC